MAIQEILGVDVGGVIIDGSANADTDTSFFGDNFLQTAAVKGAFEAIRELMDRRFGDRVFIISRCGSTGEAKTRAWFVAHRFHRITGIPVENLRFCRKRSEKAGICAKLGITHFIDDRLEIVGQLPDGVVGKFLFRPKFKEVQRFAHLLPRVQQVQSWQEVLDALF